MPTYNVTVTKTRTIVSSTEIEIKAKDEALAQEKVEDLMLKAMNGKGLEKAYDWEESEDSDDLEYDVSEA